MAAQRARPDRATLWRWLTRAAHERLLRRDGTGRKNAPYRFWLPEKHERLLETGIEWLQRLGRGEEKRWGKEGRA